MVPKYAGLCQLRNWTPGGGSTPQIPYNKDINGGGTHMFTKEDLEFVDFLFGKLVTHTDTDMIDLHDDDTCCDHIQFEQLSLF